MEYRTPRAAPLTLLHGPLWAAAHPRPAGPSMPERAHLASYWAAPSWASNSLRMPLPRVHPHVCRLLRPRTVAPEHPPLSLKCSTAPCSAKRRQSWTANALVHLVGCRPTQTNVPNLRYAGAVQWPATAPHATPLTGLHVHACNQIAACIY